MPKITFIGQDGTAHTVNASLDSSVQKQKSVLKIAHEHDIDIEGACGGNSACATCHVIVDPEWYDRLNPPNEDEENMLDLAFGVEKTSRLGCQIIMTEALDGLVVRLPRKT